MISIGTKLDDKYIVSRRLGGGGFGEVFLAEDTTIPDRKVAIKVLARPDASDHNDLIWEMRTLSRFAHPGIVTFYHHFTEESRLYLVMEFCVGGSLDDQLAQGGCHAESEVMSWGMELCETLAFVHEKGIVHHDVKPANVLFSSDGKIKLGDFGVANRNTGTRMYLPPEMLLGERVSKTDPRVDIYALGLTLLESLTGVQPFEHLTQEEALQARIAHDFVPSTLPRWVQDVFLKATHPTPELRFQTMSDFAEALIGKRVLYVFDGNRIKAHVLAEKAEMMIARKKWKMAEKLATRALQLSPDCVAALLVAGRCRLMIRHINEAKEYFSKALTISPRTHVQKELGWLSLEEGRIPVAISLLTDHLQINSSDYEAYNLLLKCFFMSDRFEAGENLARAVMDEKSPNDCFTNNKFICRVMKNGYTPEQLNSYIKDETKNPFIEYNYAVATEKPCAWAENGSPSLKSKLLFEEYRFGIAQRSGKENCLAVNFSDGTRREFIEPIISIGSLATNGIVLMGTSVSRRHAVIVNYPNEVWLYDLNSTNGVTVDGHGLIGREFFDGVRDVVAGGISMRISANSTLLV